jgi:hypothetical protein
MPRFKPLVMTPHPDRPTIGAAPPCAPPVRPTPLHALRRRNLLPPPELVASGAVGWEVMHVAALLEGKNTVISMFPTVAEAEDVFRPCLFLLINSKLSNATAIILLRGRVSFIYTSFLAGVSSLSPGDELHLTLRTEPAGPTASGASDGSTSSWKEKSPSSVTPAGSGATGRAGISTVSATVMQAADRAWLRLGPELDAAAADFRVFRVRRDVLVSAPGLAGGAGDGGAATEASNPAGAAGAEGPGEGRRQAAGGVIAPVLSVVVVKGAGLWPAPPVRRAASAAKSAAAAAAASEAFCRISVVGGLSRYTRSARAGPTGDPAWGDAFRFPLRTAVEAAEDGRGAAGRREIAEDQELVLHVYRTMPSSHGSAASGAANLRANRHLPSRLPGNRPSSCCQRPEDRDSALYRLCLVLSTKARFAMLTHRRCGFLPRPIVMLSRRRSSGRPRRWGERAFRRCFEPSRGAPPGTGERQPAPARRRCSCHRRKGHRGQGGGDVADFRCRQRLAPEELQCDAHCFELCRCDGVEDLHAHVCAGGRRWTRGGDPSYSPHGPIPQHIMA